jgi:hypothetical protein
MVVITPPSPWSVTLHDGSILTIWSSSYSVAQGEYIFDTLVDASSAEQASIDISARTPSHPERVLMVGARIAEELVLNVASGPLPGTET